MSIQNIPNELLEELCLEVRFFFLNQSYKQCKKVLWEFYTASVYQAGQSGCGQQQADRLYMYERLKEFLQMLNALDKKMQRIAPATGVLPANNDKAA